MNSTLTLNIVVTFYGNETGGTVYRWASSVSPTQDPNFSQDVIARNGHEA